MPDVTLHTTLLSTNGEDKESVLEKLAQWASSQGWSIEEEEDDITSTRTQKQSYPQQTNNSDALQSIIDASLTGVSLYKTIRDENNTIIDFEWIRHNKVVKQYSGGKTLVGKRCLEEYPGFRKTGIFDRYVKVVEENAPQDFEVQYAHDGFDTWCRIMAVKLNDGIVTSTEDITQRKKAEQEILLLKDESIQKVADRYYSIFNAIDEGFCIYELIYDDNGKPVDLRWVEVNPAYEKQTGLKDVVGKTHRELSLATETYWFDIYDKVAKTGEATYFENWHEPTHRWYHVFASRVRGGDSRQVAVVFEDITESKHSRQQQEYLLRLNDALRPLADPLEVQRVAMQLLGEHLKVDRVVYAEINIDQDYFEVIDNYTNKTVQKIMGRFPFAAFGPPGEKLKKGENLVIDDVSAAVANDDEKKVYFSIDVHAVVTLPLIKSGKLVADLSVHQAKPRNWRVNEIALIQETAERIWAAVERARAEEAYRQKLEQEVKERTRELNESTELLEAAANTSPLGMVVVKSVRNASNRIIDFEYVWLNAVSQKMAGEDVIGQQMLQKYPHVKEVGLFDAYVEAVEQDSKVDFEEYFPATQHWFRWLGVKLEDGLFISVEDITVRKNAEIKIKEQAHFIEQVVSNVPDTILIFDLAEQRNIFANPEVEMLVGYTPAELQEYGAGFLQHLILPDDWNLQTGLLAALTTLDDGEIQETEYRMRHRDGFVRWVQVRRAVFKRNKEGIVEQVIAILHDITQLKNAEKELRDEHYFLEQVTNKTPHLIYVFDLEEQRFTYINKRVNELIGQTEEYVYAMGPHLFQAILHPEDLPKRLAYLHEMTTLKEGDVREMEFRIWVVNGFRHFRTKDSIFKTENGVVKQVIGIGEDITLEKMLQEQAQKGKGHIGLN